MSTHPYSTLMFAALAAATFLFSFSAEAGKIHPGDRCIKRTVAIPGPNAKIIRHRNGSGAYVHPNGAATLQCVLDGFDRAGYNVSFVYGYACRALRTSNHPRGLAIDINQHARDVTRPTVPRQGGIQIARNCGATSGAVWGNPDNGHFEVRSMGRRQQQQRLPQPPPLPPRRPRQAPERATTQIAERQPFAHPEREHYYDPMEWLWQNHTY